MFKWWKNFLEKTHGEVCDVCGKRVKKNEHGIMIHGNKDGIYVHSEHIIRSDSYKNFVNSPWAKKVSKTIEEKGSYTMSSQEEAMI